MTTKAPASCKEYQLIEQAKAIRYGKKMPVDYQAISNAEIYYQQLKKTISFVIDKLEQNKREAITFSGTTSEQLQTLIDSYPEDVFLHVNILSRQLDFNHCLSLRSNLALFAKKTKCQVDEHLDIAVCACKVNNIHLSGFNFTGGCTTSTLLFSNCRNIYLEHLHINSSSGYAVIVRDHSHLIKISECEFSDNQRSAIMIHDGSYHCLITSCCIKNSVHRSNWAAGIVISALESVSELGVREAFEENYFFPNNLDLDLSLVPYQNLIEFCEVCFCRSSGIYIDGGNGNLLYKNQIHDNEKEGLCIDFYASTNLIYKNEIHANGNRNRQTDHDLTIDNVLIYGRMDDQSAIAKLPNISLDNAALNRIANNKISFAAGEGIKIVRSGFRNFFVENEIKNNNQGKNSMFSFSGILLGSAGCDVENDSSGLDRIASYENQISGNSISGSHKKAIVIDINSKYNQIDNNTVDNKGKYAAIYYEKSNHFFDNNFTASKISILRNYWGRLKVRIKRLLILVKARMMFVKSL